DVLFLHRKGPQEILAPAVSYALTGHLTEATARLPFALAGVAGVLAIYCLGRRIFGPLAGSVAALLLAVDGYFIAFARITQYQSIVLLMTVTSVLLLYQLRGHAAIRLLTLAAFLVAAGALAHYEAMLAVIPGAYLVWHWRQRTKPADFRTGLGAALMVGGGTLALFYLPYIVSPNFASVYSYLTEERIGGQPPYNHLADFFLRTTLYSTTYAVLLQIGLVTLGAFQLYQRTWRSPRSWLVMAAVGAGLVVTLFQPDWLLISGHSWTVLFFLVAFGSVWFLPGAGQAERMLWIWFGLLVLLALFLIAKPRTHVYVFFIPWVLLCGMVVARLTGRLAAARSPLVAHGLAASALAGCLLLFGSYAYWYFVYNRVEIFRTWSENRPAGFWTVYDQPDDQSIFGFPNRSGWKAVGVLYDQGVLQGAYTSRNTDEWVSDWYTRGADRCPRAHRYFMVSDRLGARETVRRENLLAELPATHQQWGVVTVYDEPRLEIWQRGGEPPTPQTLPIADYAAEFDARLSGPDFPLSAPAVEPVIQRPLAVQFGNQIVLEGYALDQDAIAAGATVQLTLYWRAREPVDTRYIVVNEVRRNEDGAAVAHAAGEPGCDAQRTTDWVVGELIADRYDLPIADGAEPGVYSVVTRMEERDTGSILPSSIGESVTLGAVRIEE
ncbi:MAG: hypothetical protein DCC55_39795, partial [Chloroflexi bacterium]